MSARSAEEECPVRRTTRAPTAGRRFLHDDHEKENGIARTRKIHTSSLAELQGSPSTAGTKRIDPSLSGQGSVKRRVVLGELTPAEVQVRSAPRCNDVNDLSRSEGDQDLPTSSIRLLSDFRRVRRIQEHVRDTQHLAGSSNNTRQTHRQLKKAAHSSNIR
jgi:hypothetical protein